MIPRRIEGHTRYLGKPPGWEPETHGNCAHLAIQDTDIEGQPVMRSAWEPTPEELRRLYAGASVILTVAGTGHPPVMMTVGDMPE